MVIKIKTTIIKLLAITCLLSSCGRQTPKTSGTIPDSLYGTPQEKEKEEPSPEKPAKEKVVIEKDFIYDKYTLDDRYPYKDTVRVFQWDKIKELLGRLDSFQTKPQPWGILKNKSNSNGVAKLVKNYTVRDGRVYDPRGAERYQSAPLYSVGDSLTPELYGRDGALVKLRGEQGNFYVLEVVYFDGEWLVPKRYVAPIDTIIFEKVMVVDRTNQNIASLEKSGSKWLVRSMNPATTGVHRPPFMYETPLGIFVIQEKRPRMLYLKDGTTLTGGFAPYASRFSSGAYIHGVPVNAPGKAIVEYSPSIGTTPRSHMCVRNLTSHAKFIYDWAPVNQSLVFVIE